MTVKRGPLLREMIINFKCFKRNNSGHYTPRRKEVDFRRRWWSQNNPAV